MEVTVNGITYTTTVSNGITTVSWDTGSKATPLPETEAIKEAILGPLREQRSEVFEATDWRATVDYPGADQQDWLDYRQAWRDIPQKYLYGEDLTIPVEPMPVVIPAWDRDVEYHLDDVVSFEGTDYKLFNEPTSGSWINRFIANNDTTDQSAARWYGLTVDQLLEHNDHFVFNSGGGPNGSRYIGAGTPVYGGAMPSNDITYWKAI